MKKLLLSFAVITFTSFIHTPVKPSNNPEDINKLIAYMEETRAFFLDHVKDLSETQLDFKAAPDKWSIRQCIEHITISEKMIFAFIQTGFQQPEDSLKHKEVKVTDDQLIAFLTDRSRKAQAPDFLKPINQFKTKEEAIDTFMKQRDANEAFIKTTNINLRNHYIEHPLLGLLDCYQGFLLLTAHSKRHTLQIQEVKDDPAFPKN